MMDRNREARRGPMAASVNGGSGLSRRRQQKTNNQRDSPEEDGAVEFQDMTGRLRDRVGKKDRDRERSVNRSKRRRGERILHGSNRDDGGETSDDSLEDDDEDDDEESGVPTVPIRVPLPPSSMGPSPSSVPSSLPSNQLYHHQHRKSILPAKGIRAPPLLTAAEEIVVPRKARSGTASKRSRECWVSGSGAGGAGGGSSGGVSGSGDPMNTIRRQTSTSPGRHSPVSTVPVLPTSTNGPAVPKKMKPMSGQKHRPPKVMKSPFSVQDIEFEVAEVLFAMTRQFQAPTKQEMQKPETNGSVNDSKSRVSSPSHLTTTSQSSVQPSPNLSPIPSVVAPKRKKPRAVGNIEEGGSTNQQHHVASSTPGKLDGEETTKMEVVSPKLYKHTTSSTVIENGSASHDLSLPQKTAIPAHGQQESSKMEVVSDSKFSSSEADINQTKEPIASSSCKKEALVESDENHDNSEKKIAADCSRVEKFKFDLMVTPSSKSSPEAEASSEYSGDRKPLLPDDMSKTTAIAKLEEERAERASKMESAESVGDVKMTEKTSLQNFESKDSLVKEERALDLQINIEKTDEDLPSSSSRKQHQKHQQSKLPKQEKGQPASLPLPMAVAGWPGALPPIGYMGQVPSLQAAFPLDGSNGTSKSMQMPHFPSPQLRTKRCATHCYIAQNIYYHQQIARMNPFWAAAPGGVPVFGAKPPYNLNSVPSSDSILLNPLQGGYPGRSIGSLPDKSGPVTGAGAAAATAVFGGNSSKDKISVVDNFPESEKWKSHGIPQGASMHPPFLFPMNQQQAVTATAVATTARSGGVKVLGDDSSNMPPLSSNSSSSVAVAPGTNSASIPTVSFNYANLPANEAPYVTILQNNGYSFPIPAHVGTVPQYRGNHQAMPYFGGPFYTSQMIHPSQLPQQTHPAQPRLQNTSNSSGSTSSQKHSQQQVQRVSGAAASTGSAPHSLSHSKHRQQQSSHHHARQLEGDAGSEESPLTVDSRASHGLTGGAYASNFGIPLHPQDYANIMSRAAIAMGVGSGNHSDKHHPMTSTQNQHGNMKIDLTQSPAFAMSFAAFNGAAGGGAGVPPSALDFSSLMQNPVFQSLPEATRQSYQMAAAAATQHKNSHKSKDGKHGNGDSANSKLLGEDERKITSAGKSPGGFSQHSLSFSRADGDVGTTTILSNTAIDGSRPSAVSGSRSSSATPSTAGAATSNASLCQINQQPQQLVQLQQLHKQQQQQVQMQQQQVQMQQQLAPRSKPVSSNSSSIYSDHPPSSTVVARFPNTLGGHFPQAIIQGATHNQSTHWKTSAQPSSAVPSPAKNHVPQQLMRASQPALPGHQMQISFTSNSQKAQQSGQPPNSNPSGVSAVAGSPQASSNSKTTGGSPRASSATKPFQPQQQSSKNSPSGTSQKSSPVTNRNTPSILGNPHSVSSAPNPSMKQHIHQQQQQQQVPKIYPFSPQLYFSNAAAYLQAQTPQGNAAGYFQRRPSDQQQHPNSTSISSSMLSLCSQAPTLTGSNVASDPAKSVAAATANTMKGGLQPAQLAVGGAQGGSHPIMAAPGFPYIHGMPSMSVKPVESSKPAGGGNESNVHSCWQPEKR